MIRDKVTLVNKTGLHARPAGSLVQQANQFKSEITLSYRGAEADAKSIMGIMSLGAEKGSQVTIEASGRDEREAVAKLAAFISTGLGEGE